MGTNRQCEDCAAWHHGGGAHDPFGECRINPPTVGMTGAVWPNTKHDDWCVRWCEQASVVDYLLNALLHIERLAHEKETGRNHNTLLIAQIAARAMRKYKDGEL